MAEVIHSHSVFSSRQLMPPPLSAPVNGVRPRIEERRATQGPVGKGILLWADKYPPPPESLHDSEPQP